MSAPRVKFALSQMAGHRMATSRGRRFQAALVGFLYRFLNAFLHACAFLLWPRPRPRSAKRVLIYRIGNIGDITCALPAMRAIRRAYPSAHLTLLTSPGSDTLPGAKEILEGVDWIDEICTYYTKNMRTMRDRINFLKTLRQQSWDVWINLSPAATGFNVLRELRDMLFARMVSPGWARGWEIDTIPWALQAQSEFLDFPGEVDRMLALVARPGFVTQPVEFGLASTEKSRKAIDESLSQFAKRDLVALGPGAKRRTNRWPLERFAEIAAHLASKGIICVILGSADDRSAGDVIANTAASRVINLAGNLSLTESIEVLRRCRLVICNDSGIQHLASAVETPVLSIFSCRDLCGKWYPYGSNSNVLQKWVPCHTCMLEECPNENQCMRSISTEEVIQQAEKMLPR